MFHQILKDGKDRYPYKRAQPADLQKAHAWKEVNIEGSLKTELQFIRAVNKNTTYDLTEETVGKDNPSTETSVLLKGDATMPDSVAFDRNFSLDGSEADIAVDGYDGDSGLSFTLDSGMTYERETRIVNQSEPRPTGEGSFGNVTSVTYGLNKADDKEQKGDRSNVVVKESHNRSLSIETIKIENEPESLPSTYVVESSQYSEAIQNYNDDAEGIDAYEEYHGLTETQEDVTEDPAERESLEEKFDGDVMALGHDNFAIGYDELQSVSRQYVGNRKRTTALDLYMLKSESSKSRAPATVDPAPALSKLSIKETALNLDDSDGEDISLGTEDWLFEQSCLNLNEKADGKTARSIQPSANSHYNMTASDTNWDAWDDSDHSDKEISTSQFADQKQKPRSMLELCGVEPDPNFVEDDWDD